jgi:hypothetical protein
VLCGVVEGEKKNAPQVSWCSRFDARTTCGALGLGQRSGGGWKEREIPYSSEYQGKGGFVNKAESRGGGELTIIWRIELPVITADTKLILGTVSAGDERGACLIGNVLAARILAFFTGRRMAVVRRPLMLWALFFLSAVIALLVGSMATFAPVMSERSLPTRQVDNRLMLVVQELIHPNQGS